MRKFFSLIAAVLFAGSMMADVVTINATDVTTIESGTTGDLSATVSDIKIDWNGAFYNKGEGADQDIRVYGGKTITLTAGAAISKVEITGYAKKDLAVTTSAGSVTTGASYSAETTKKTWEDPLIVVENINATSVTLTCSKQMRAYAIRLTLGEGGGDDPGEGGEGDAIVLDVVYGEAAYFSSYSAWQLNLYKDYDEETEVVTYPDLYIVFAAKSGTAIAGTYAAADLKFTQVFTSENDSAEATSYATDLVIEHQGDGVYNVKLNFVGDDNVTYVVDWTGEVAAYDGDTDEDIVLDEDGGETPPTPEELATEGIHTLTPVKEDAAGAGTYSKIIDGIQLDWTGAYYETDFRAYANNSFVITAGANIEKVEIAGLAKKGLAIVVSAGEVTTGDNFSAETTKADIEDPLIVIENINATSLKIDCNKQLQARIIRVTLEGAQGIEETLSEGKAVKVIREGQLFIMKGDHTFTPMGQIVK